MTATRSLFNGGCLAACIVCISPAGTAAAAEADPVAAALAAVRGVKADLFARESGTLGLLPGPAELAAAQPDRRTLLRPAAKPEYAFTDEQRRAFKRDYAQPNFTGRPRMTECFPLGVTGIHARDIADRIELVVVAVEEGSPADGRVQINDIIIGAGGRLFDDPMDPRPAMGYALAAAQTPEAGGKLALQLVRSGEPMNVALQLAPAPAFSAAWPDGCARTKQIADAALRCVLDRAPPAKDLMNMSASGGFWTPLFLMASGDPAAMDLVCRWAWHESREKDVPVTKPDGNNWGMAYNLVNLCEYQQLTGEKAVLPKIRRLVRQIERNQYVNVGTWGHGMPTGYGPVNNVGLVCFIGLILARDCGIDVDPVVLSRAVRFFGQFCGTNIGYGEGAAGGRSGRMDNGMSSMAAVAFRLLGESDMAERWGRSVCYMWMGRERGHAERIFAMAWGPLGACAAPSAEFHMHMNNLLWYYELARTRDGAFAFTAYGSATRGRFPYPVGSTSAIGLSLYLPQRRLRIMGAPKPTPAQQAERREELAKSTLALAGRNLTDDPAAAKEQLAALESLLGGARPEIAQLRSRLPEQTTASKARKPAAALKSAVKPRFDLFGGKKAAGEADWAPPPDYIAAQSLPFFRGKTPEQIARYLAHPNGLPYVAAVRALAGHGSGVIPLLEKLMGDKNPWIRGGALDTLGELNKYEGSAARPVTPELTRAMEVAGKLFNDRHPAVQEALGSFAEKLRIETPQTRQMAVTMAGSGDAAVRGRALGMARHWIKDAETVVRIGILVSGARGGNVPGDWNIAHMLIGRHATEPFAKPALPVMAAFLRNQANTRPYRGFFSDGAQLNALQVMRARWDAETERLPDLVPGLCRAYVRVPYHNYRGWVRTRDLAWELLQKCGPDSAAALRDTVAEEKAWLAEVPDDLLQTTTETKPDEARAKARELIGKLEELAAALNRSPK